MDVMKYDFVPVSIEKSYEDDSDLIDIEVEGTHTFCLEGGYVTHNTACSARDRIFQAILPLKGKPLNVNDRTLNSCLLNSEIRSIISAIGVQIGNQTVDITDLRYHKIVLLCLTGETRIPLLNGKTYTIEELSNGKAGDQFWVYSSDKNGRMVPGLGYLPRKTGETNELIEIVFDDGSIVRCTSNHRWILRDGKEVLAENLKCDDSLLSFHRRISKMGYEQIYDHILKSWENVHSLIAAKCYEKELQQCLFESFDVKDDHPIVHHVDFNKLNNSPDNLLWMLRTKHFKYHMERGKELITAYNISQEHKDRIKELHKNGHYKDFTWSNTYNGTEKQLRAVIKAWKDENKRKKMLSGLEDYKGSEKNSQTASDRNRKMWENEEYRKKMINILRENNDSVLLSDRTKNQWKKDGMKEKMIKSKVLKLLNKLISEGFSGEELQREFNIRKANNTVRFEKAIERWGIEILEESECYNRRIVSVKKIVLEKSVPVYNLVVYGTHSYMLENGVVTKNSDADPDGGHIACLLITLFYKFMRKLIEEGHVYLCDLPLYRVQWKGQSKYLKDDLALEEFKKEHANSNIEVSRFKGLGEMSVEELEETAMDPTTRILRKIHIEDDVEAADVIEELMGSNAGSRKTFINDALKFEEGVV